MPLYDTPYGQIDAPTPDAMKAWLAKKRGAVAQQPAAPATHDKGALSSLWEGMKAGWSDKQFDKPSDVPGGAVGIAGALPSRFLHNMWEGLKEGVTMPGRVASGEQPITGTAEDARLGLPTASLMAGGGFRPNAPARLGSAPPALSSAQHRLGDFERQGVTPNVPAIGQGPVTARAAQLGRLVPFSPVTKGIEKNLGEMGQAADRAAGQYGQAGDIQDMFGPGAAARNALRGFAGDRSAAKSDYDKFFAQMHGAPPVPVSNTLAVTRRIMGQYPSEPELRSFLTKEPIEKLARLLSPRTEQIPAKTSPVLDQFGKPTVTAPATSVQRGGTLTVNELKDLRTKIGYQLEHPSFGPDDIPRAQLKQLYAGLTSDMKSAARARGPGAAKALLQATTAYGARMKLLDRLESLTNKDAPEAVFSAINAAAGSGRSADSGLLASAKKAMPVDEWGNLSAAILRRLGNPVPSVRRAATADSPFSPQTFLTNWNKLSPRAKDLLFGKEGETARDNVDSLVRVGDALNWFGRSANPSRSGEMVGAGVGMYLLEQVVQDVWAGQGKAAALKVGAALSGWGMAKALMSPEFTRFLYERAAPYARQAGRAAGTAARAVPALGARAGLGEEGKRTGDRQRLEIAPGQVTAP